MVMIAPAEREVMDSRHDRQARRTRPKAPAQLRPRNLQVVLDMGNKVYFAFRGRAYGVPPLPWRQGQKLLSLWTEAVSYGANLDSRERTEEYFAIVRQLARLIWRNVRPAGRVLKTMRLMGLLRNPFLQATEAEVVEIAHFLLQRRMRSDVRFHPAEADPDRET